MTDSPCGTVTLIGGPADGMVVPYNSLVRIVSLTDDLGFDESTTYTIGEWACLFYCHPDNPNARNLFDPPAPAVIRWVTRVGFCNSQDRNRWERDVRIAQQAAGLLSGCPTRWPVDD